MPDDFAGLGLTRGVGKGVGSLWWSDGFGSESVSRVWRGALGKQLIAAFGQRIQVGCGV